MVKGICLKGVKALDVVKYSEDKFPPAEEFADRLLQGVKDKPAVAAGKFGMYRVRRNVVDLSDIGGRSLGALWEAAHEAVHVYQQRGGLLLLWGWGAVLLAVGGIVGWWLMYRSHHDPAVMFLLVLASVFVWAIEDLDATKKAEGLILANFSLNQSQRDQLSLLTKLTYLNCFERPAGLAFLMVAAGFAVFGLSGVVSGV